MITKYYDVILVDFAGFLPFKLEKKEILTKKETLSMEKLFEFLHILEKNLKQTTCYIGSDMLESKLFHRILLTNGMVELLIGTPITLVAHFKSKSDALVFREALVKTVMKELPTKYSSLLLQSINIRHVSKNLKQKRVI